MKQLYVFITILLVSAQVYGQKYDYLEILRSFPPLPENTLTASEKEEERWKEKLSPINELLWDLEREQYDNEKRGEYEPLDATLEEWERLYMELMGITTPLDTEWMEIVDQWREVQVSLLEMSGSTYENRLNLQREIDARNRHNLRERRRVYEEVAPLVERLGKAVGISLLRDMYTSMSQAYFYNAGTGEEMDRIDALRELQKMFGN